jgi:exosortase/archaeosortase family protein
LNINIQKTNRPSHGLSVRLISPSFLWKLLAGSQALLSLWLIQSTQDSPSLTLLCVVIWGGAIICFEDQLEQLAIRPSRASLMAGFTLLLYASWRSTVVLHHDANVTVLPLIQGLGLALMARPFTGIRLFREPLLVLSLFPGQLVLSRLLPEYLLAVITGRVSQLMLLLFGENASVSGRVLDLGGGGVVIANTCSSIDLIAQVSAIAIVFVLAFPIRSRGVRLLYLGLAPLVALVVNAARIAILAAIEASALAQKDDLFIFLHEKWGSLVFAAIATMLMGQIYLMVIDRELRQRHG